MRLSVPVLALLAAFAATPALADKGGRRDDDRSRVEEARKRADILPIEGLLALLAKEIDGEIVEIEFEDDEGRGIFEVYYLDAAGRRHEIKVDAVSGAILKREVDD